MYLCFNNTCYNQDMNRLSIEEFKNNIDDIVENGLKEEIIIYDGEEELFSLVPPSQRLIREWENYFGSLPKEAYDNNDIERE